MLNDNEKWAGALLAKRQVLPRWHSPQTAAERGERSGNFRPSLRDSKPELKWLTSLEEQSQREQPHAAIELSETAYILDPKSERWSSPSSTGVHMLWSKAANIRFEFAANPDNSRQLTNSEFARLEISRLRAILRSNPHLALVWSEMARNYLILGDDTKASRSMACALGLAPNNPYLTRASVRLYVHLDQPDRALNLLRKNPATRHDPRLLAAEIALADAGKVAGNWAAAAARIIGDANYRPALVSDLTAALATLDMANGKHKKARQLFSRTIAAPSENALAQTQWASERDSKIVIPHEAWMTPGSDEARALAARVNGDWDGVLDAAECWLDSEAFSSRPAAMASFATFTEEQNQRSEAIASKAIDSNPHVSLLWNNRAVVRAYLGKSAEAFADVEAALANEKSLGTQEPVLFATLGLVAYRRGYPSLGNSCYAKAINTLNKDKRPRSAALGMLFWIREELRYDPVAAQEALAQIKKTLPRITNGEKIPEMESMLSAVENELLQATLVPLSGTEMPEDPRLNEVANEYVPERDESLTLPVLAKSI